MAEQVGKYEIRGRLGAGAMGTVMDAFDVVIERRAALKVIPRPAAGDIEGQESLARFKREAQAAGRLNHPNIVAVYDYGEDHENAWIAMELVEGGTLKQVLDRGERFALPEIGRVMEQILAGLDYSHKRGVVHRDIKPANIMLTSDGTVKIADFGIARIENSSMTQVGTVMGTPSYMAPEQLRGEPVDSRADIWASGVLLYQLLTGEKPFEGGFSAVQHKAIHTEPTPPSTLSVTAPRGFDAVVAKAMAKRPEDRFASAADFAAAIRGALSAPAAAAPLPMADSDATVVSGTMRPAAPPPVAAAAPPPPKAKSGPPVVLIGGGVAAVLVAGAAAFMFLGNGTGPAPSPTPAPTTITLAPTAGPSTDTPAPSMPSAPVAAPPSAPAPRPADVAVLQAAPAAPSPAAPPPAPLVPTPVPVAPAPAPARPTPVTPAPVAPTPATPTPALVPATPGPSPSATVSTGTFPSAPLPPAERPTPPQQLALAPRPALDFRAAARAAAAAPACGLIAASATDDALTLEGVLRRGEDGTLRRALAARDIPLASARLAVQGFDGPYCPATDVLRPYLATPDAGPHVRPVGNLPLVNGQLLRFDVTMPDWAGNLYVAYFMSSGEVAHLVPSAPHPGNATVRLGEPRAGFPGWEVSEPFGTDLLVAMVSEGPLFPVLRPEVEKQEAYLAALAEALRNARGQNRRVQIRPFVIETAAR
ncbi:serine/threonine protein kinase [Roseococcus sp. SYP-B2431]|uniref:serine/threonine-protein kinase n=1 Tax=Roseococcus sp. SYP-B2431 TaxID=2496640 RepID=UPI001039017E|nr:serine/threonine-protein kinase [Roseococcus sp. SYP-B2431]TCH99464.1 serine/threonine protein kinase [Roseococcus sp. SYP-B2431]